MKRYNVSFSNLSFLVFTIFYFIFVSVSWFTIISILIEFIKGLIILNWVNFPGTLIVIFIVNFVLYKGQYNVATWYDFKFPFF
jgi:hypothetical protein